MKRELLKLCILLTMGLFTRPIYAAESNCACMEYEDIKTEKEVYESPQKLKEYGIEFAEFEILESEDILLADY